MTSTGHGEPWRTWQAPEIVAPDPNALHLYEVAFDLHDEIAMTRLEPSRRGESEHYPDLPPAPFSRVEHAEPDEVEQLCSLFAPVFRLFEEAFAGRTQLPPARDWAQRWPRQMCMREAADMFAMRSRLRRGEGRVVEAGLDAIACIRLATDVLTERSLISALIALAVQAPGRQQLAAIIPELDAPGARACVKALQRAMVGRPTFAEVLEEGFFARRQLVVHVPAFGGSGESAEVEFPEDLSSVDPARTWHELSRQFAAIEQEARKPWCERENLEFDEDPVLDALMPLHWYEGLRLAVTDARLNVALAALAAQAWLGEQGSLPTSLDALVPDYLPEVPRDPFVEAPLRSRLMETDGASALIIYSVGPDGDDDGGADIATRVDADSDGDIAIVLTAE